MRGTRPIAAALVAIAVAAGFVAALAIASPPGRRFHAGEIAGRAYVLTRGASGVVKVFDASRRLVGRHEVRSGDAHFRFIVRPGSYKVKLKLRPPAKEWPLCHANVENVHVRANRTRHVTLSQGCENSY
jgi:hypothetical protein